MPVDVLEPRWCHFCGKKFSVRRLLLLETKERVYFNCMHKCPVTKNTTQALVSVCKSDLSPHPKSPSR